MGRLAEDYSAPVSRWQAILRIAAWSALYFAAARLGLLLATVHGSISPVWPATGVAIGALRIGGRRLWPAVLIGATLANLLTEAPTIAVGLIAVGNTVEAVLGAWIWDWIERRDKFTPNVREIAAIAVASLVAPLISASVGVTALLLFDGLVGDGIAPLWVTWWTGDALGALVVGPAIASAAEFGVAVRDGNRQRQLQLAAVVLATAATGWVAFAQPNGAPVFAIFPVVLLAAAWFGRAGARWTALLFCVFGVAAAARGHGPLGGGTLNEDLLNMQVFLGSVALAALVLPVIQASAQFALPLLVLLGGWVLSGWMFQLLERDATSQQRRFFSERVAEAQAAIRVRMGSYNEVLRAAASYFSAAGEVRREDWRVYVQTLQLDDRYPGINGLGVIFAIEPPIDQWVAARRADGAPALEVHPFPGSTPQPNDPYYIITYVEPQPRNSAATIGRNIGSEPSRRSAAESARDGGQPRLHHRIEGSRDLQRRSGLLLYHPIYRRDAPTATVAERRRAHLGWIYAQIFPDRFLDGALGPLASVLELHLFEAGKLDRQRLLYSSVPDQGGELPAFERVGSLELAGQYFQLGWRRGPNFPAAEKSPAVWAASSFGLATLLLAGLVMSLQTSGRRARAAVTVRTAELAASEERFRQAFEFAGIGMALTGLDGRWWQVNRALSQMLGYAEAELLQTTLAEVTHPADRDLDLELIQQVMEGRRQSCGTERRLRHRDGRELWVHVTVSLVRNEAGQPLHGVMQIEDVTAARQTEAALRKSEQMFHRLFESSPDAILLADTVGRVVRTNRRAAELFGWSEWEMPGRPLESLLPPRIREQHGSRLAAFYRDPSAQAAALGLELVGARKSGEEFPLDLMLSPVATEDGAQTLAVARDITDRKALESNLAQARDEAMRASRLKSEFIASMSHEIRTPMNAVLGMAEALAETRLASDQQEMLGLLRAGAENLLTIVSDVLDIAKIEAGKMRLTPAPFRARKVLEQTVALFAARARQKGLDIWTDFSAVPAEPLMGDAGRIQQVLANLLGNAIKFTDRGEVSVTARRIEERGTNARWRVAVRDTGPGIPVDLQAQLFRPFVQAEEASQSRGGTGLGLAISRQLIELMGGEIGLESQPGQGSTFHFTLELPFAAATSAAVPAATTRLLVVDDNEDDRLLLQAKLSGADLQIECVGGAREALAALRAAVAAGRPIEWLLVDWHLGGMDGLGLAAEIWADPLLAEVRLLLMSGGPVADPATAIEAGFEGFLSKPVSRAALEALLRRPIVGQRLAGATPSPAVKPPRILVAEDNPANQAVASAILARIGAEVDLVPDGKVALERLAQDAYDAVLMDCQMPNVDGYEATRRIRLGAVPGVNPRTVIIAVTAYARDEDRAHCFEAGMNDYVTKPLRSAELRAALTRCGVRVGRPTPAPAATPAATTPGSPLDARTVETLRRLPGERGPSLLPELVGPFRELERDAIERMDESLRRGAGPDLAEQAHAFASNAAAVGGLVARDASLALERAVRELPPENWPRAFTHLRRETERLRAALEALQFES